MKTDEAELFDAEYVCSTEDREAWLLHRMTGLGGSDAGAVLGVSPWSTPYTTWADKCMGQSQDLSDNEAVRWGTVLEQPIAQEWAEQQDLELVHPNAMYRSLEHHWMLASPDGAIEVGDSKPQLVEIKTCGLRSETDWDDGMMPVTYQCQVHHYLETLQLDVARVVCLIGGQRLVEVTIERSDEVSEMLLTAESEFWAKHVRTGTPPAMEGLSDEAAQWQVLNPAIPDLEVEVSPVPFQEMAAAKETLKEAQAAANWWKAKIQEVMGSATIATHNGETLATYKAQETTRVQAKLLRQLHPTIAAACSATTTSRVLWLK